MTFDGLPDKRWEGLVDRVAPGLREAAGREVGEVLGKFADPGGALPPNASVNVQIIVAKSAHALVIPRAALSRGDGKRTVYILSGEKAHRKEIEVGLIGLNEVEVVNGLSEGETVLLAGAVPLSEGARVTIART